MYCYYYCYYTELTFYSTAVTPWNPLLFGCHLVNEVAQLTQGARWVNHWYLSGDKSASASASEEKK